MREYRVTVDRKGWLVPILSLVLFALALSGMVFGITVPHFRVLGDAAFMVLAVLAILLAKRFIFRSYRYMLVRRDFEAAYDLEILELVGRRERVVCRVALDDLALVQRESKKNRRAFRRAHRRYMWYDYSMDAFFGSAVLLTLRGEEEAVLRLSYDRELVRLLSLYADDGESEKNDAQNK